MILPVEWETTINKMIKEKGTVVLIGGSDTGKTTFALSLANDALAKEIPTALVDADLGQSTIGPPTTIGLSLLKKGDDLKEPKVNSIYFVGDTSPFSHLLQSVVGTKRLVEKARTLGAKLIVVDTSGLITGAMGQALKYHEVQVIGGDHIVALQRSTELEFILRSLSHYQKPQLYNLKVPIEVRRVSPEMRARHRKIRFQKYFRDSRVYAFKAKKISVYPPIVDLVRRRDYQNLIVALKDAESETEGIGIIVNQLVRDELVEVLTPIKTDIKIRGLELGFLRLSEEGDELGRIKLWKS